MVLHSHLHQVYPNEAGSGSRNLCARSSLQPLSPSQGHPVPSMDINSHTAALEMGTALTLFAPDPLKPIAKEKQRVRSSGKQLAATRWPCLESSSLPGEPHTACTGRSDPKLRAAGISLAEVVSLLGSHQHRHLLGTREAKAMQQPSAPLLTGARDGGVPFSSLPMTSWKPLSASASPSVLLASLGGLGARGMHGRASKTGYMKEKE